MSELIKVKDYVYIPHLSLNLLKANYHSEGYLYADLPNSIVIFDENGVEANNVSKTVYLANQENKDKLEQFLNIKLQPPIGNLYVQIFLEKVDELIQNVKRLEQLSSRTDYGNYTPNKIDAQITESVERSKNSLVKLYCTALDGEVKNES